MEGAAASPEALCAGADLGADGAGLLLAPPAAAAAGAAGALCCAPWAAAALLVAPLPDCAEATSAQIGAIADMAAISGVLWRGRRPPAPGQPLWRSARTRRGRNKGPRNATFGVAPAPLLASSLSSSFLSGSLSLVSWPFALD